MLSVGIDTKMEINLITILEIVRVIVNIIGIVAATWVLFNTLEDRRYLVSSQRNGYMMIIARRHIRAALSLLTVQVLFLIPAVLAMLEERGPIPLITILSLIITTLLLVNSYYDHHDRKDLYTRIRKRNIIVR